MTSATLRAWRTSTVSAPGSDRSRTSAPAAPRLSDALKVAKRTSARGPATAGAAAVRTSPAMASTAIRTRRVTRAAFRLDGADDAGGESSHAAAALTRHPRTLRRGRDLIRRTGSLVSGNLLRGASRRERVGAPGKERLMSASVAPGRLVARP